MNLDSILQDKEDKGIFTIRKLDTFSIVERFSGLFKVDNLREAKNKAEKELGEEYEIKEGERAGDPAVFIRYKEDGEFKAAAILSTKTMYGEDRAMVSVRRPENREELIELTRRVEEIGEFLESEVYPSKEC